MFTLMFVKLSREGSGSETSAASAEPQRDQVDVLIFVRPSS